LIKNLGRQHTILLSTHILPEVEMTCSRVIIIHKGANRKRAIRRKNLLGKNQTSRRRAVELESEGRKTTIGEEQLKKIPGVRGRGHAR